MKIGVTFFFIAFSSVAVYSQSKVSTKNGAWSDPTVWSPAGVPTSANDVTISASHQVSITANANCNNLVIGAGGSPRLFFSGNTARTLIVAGSITNNAVFDQATTSNRTHELRLSGNIVNNGVLNFHTDFNSEIELRCTNTAANQLISGTGSTTKFFTIVLTKGSQIRTLEIATTNFSVAPDFLTLTSGTIKFSSPGAFTLVPTTVAFIIPTAAGIWMNAPAATMSFSNSVTLNGLFRISTGNVDIGNANNEDLIASVGSLIMEGGTLDIAGKYRANGSAVTFSMTGGTLKVPSVSTSNTGIAPFNLTAAGSTFVMSGGTILLRREGGGGSQDLGYINTGASISTVTGGTLQLGDATTPASQTISINSTAPIANIVVASANVTAKIITNPLTVVNNFSISAGSINANAQVINVSGNWSNAGTFVPTTGTVNFNGSGSQVISKPGAESFNSVTFSGVGLKTLGAPMSVAAGFTIQSGANVDVTTSNYSINLSGNFVNNGTFQSRNGLFRFVGTTAQTISGSSTSDFYDLTITNASGVTLNSPANLRSTLSLSNGVLNTNAQAFTIVSNANGTGRVGPITGTGNLNGNVIVQRFMPGGSTGWVLMGKNQSNTLTFADWDDDLFITCPSCPDGSLGGFTSIYSYDETQPGIYDAPASFVPISSINNTIDAGKGYWVYAGTGQFTTTGVTTDATGPINKFNTTINLTRTNTGSAIDDGWNLLHNPYPCAISWTSLRGATANLDNAIYVYNADLNGGTGGYASFVNGVSSPAVGAGGVGDQIAMGQGFYVHSTGATSLVAQETHKSLIDPTYLKPNPIAQQLLRLRIDGQNNMNDETVLYFEANATNAFDELYDANKLRGNDPFAPILAMYSNAMPFQINGVAPLAGTYTMDVLATTGYSGTYTLSAVSFSSLPKGTCFTMFDRATSTSFDLRTSNYVFYLADTTVAPRFRITLTNNALALTKQHQVPSCNNANGGKVIVGAQNAGPWNYTWSLNGQVVKTSTNKTSADTLTNLSGGSVEVDVFTAGGCDYGYQTVVLPSMEFATAAFVCDDSGYVNIPVAFTNSCVNTQSYSWNFGDGVGSSIATDPIYTFLNAGTYQVRLVAGSSTSCNDTVTKNIRILEPTGISKSEAFTNNLTVKTLGNKHFQLLRNYSTNEPRTIKVLNMAGSTVKSVNLNATNAVDYELNLSDVQDGLYILQIDSRGTQEYRKLVVTK